MIKAIIVSTLILGSVFWMSANFIGYEKAGKYYIGKQRKARKSIRAGSRGYYGVGYYGSRGFRGGK